LGEQGRMQHARAHVQCSRTRENRPQSHVHAQARVALLGCWRGVAGFTSRANRNTKPAESAYKADSTSPKSRERERARATKAVHNASCGGSWRRLCMLLLLVSGALAAGCTGRANSNAKPATCAYKADSTSPQSRDWERARATKAVRNASWGGSWCRLYMRLLPVEGVLAAGLPGRAKRNTKPATSSHRAHSTSR